MEIILSKQCKALTGSLGQGDGYFIQRRRAEDGSVRFFSQRSKHPPIPRYGHLRFIFLCASLAQMKLHVSDIRVKPTELADALRETGIIYLADFLTENINHLLDEMNAADIINFKNNYKL